MSEDEEQHVGLCAHCAQPFDNSPRPGSDGPWFPTICVDCYKAGWRQAKSGHLYQKEDAAEQLFKQKPAAKPAAKPIIKPAAKASPATGSATKPATATRMVHQVVSRTFNTGNYESIRLEVGIDSSFELADDVFKACLRQLNKEAEALSLAPTGEWKE